MTVKNESSYRRMSVRLVELDKQLQRGVTQVHRCFDPDERLNRRRLMSAVIDAWRKCATEGTASRTIRDLREQIAIFRTKEMRHFTALAQRWIKGSDSELKKAVFKGWFDWYKENRSEAAQAKM